jgi:hypothetical protein
VFQLQHCRMRVQSAPLMTTLVTSPFLLLQSCAAIIVSVALFAPWCPCSCNSAPRVQGLRRNQSQKPDLAGVEKISKAALV